MTPTIPFKSLCIGPLTEIILDIVINFTIIGCKLFLFVRFIIWNVPPHLVIFHAPMTQLNHFILLVISWIGCMFYINSFCTSKYSLHVIPEPSYLFWYKYFLLNNLMVANFRVANPQL